MQTAASLDIDTHYPLTRTQIEFFRENGFIRLKDVLDPEVLAYYRPAITEKVKELNRQHLPMEQRSTYAKAFLQIMNIWEFSDVVKEFVLGKRLGRIAAELMGVRGVRLYHDQALYKEPGGGVTPWHADQFYWPLSSEKTVTAWIPLHAVSADMGPLAICPGTHRMKFGRDLEISDESEQKLGDALKNNPMVNDPYDLGEVSFHTGWTFHRAGPNKSELAREVMTIIYMDEDMRLIEPRTKQHKGDREQWCKGAEVGGKLTGPTNPLIWEEGM